MGVGLRYFGGALAFGFAAVWIMASLAAALVCLLSGVLAYGAVCVAEGMHAKRTRQTSGPRIPAPRTLGLRGPTPGARDLPQWADALNVDLGHLYDPAAAMSPLAREAEYGWPLSDDTIITGGTLQ